MQATVLDATQSCYDDPSKQQSGFCRASSGRRSRIGGVGSANDPQVILPVWREVTQADVAKHSPLLAGGRAVSTGKRLDVVANEILRLRA